MASNNTIQITLPASKSISNRWLMLDYLSANGIKIKNLSTADDTQLLKRLLRQLKMGRRHTFDCRDAGMVARFMTAILAFTPGQNIITGSERLCQRPMAPLIDALRSIGCTIECTQKEGFLPLKIEGCIPSSNRVRIDGSLSSQYVSALLMAAIALPQGLSIEVCGNKASEPYIDMTLQIMESANVDWSYKGNPPAYHVAHTLPRYDIVTVEKDWSAASYFYAAQALCPTVNIRMSGLYKESIQGDNIVCEIFSILGVNTQQNDLCIETSFSATNCERFDYNFSQCPDLFPATAVTCAALGIEAHLSGLSNLHIKESDRVQAIVEELNKMGCKTHTTNDEVTLYPSELKIEQPVDAHEDHRIAMAFAVLKLKFPNIIVTQQEVVTKSFPNFWEMLDRIVQQNNQ